MFYQQEESKKQLEKSLDKKPQILSEVDSSQISAAVESVSKAFEEYDQVLLRPVPSIDPNMTFGRRKKEVECGVCEQIVTNPINCRQCSHLSCQDCVVRVCPNCKLSNAFDTFRLLAVATGLNAMEFECNNCSDIFTYENYQYHYAKCQAELICPGCPLKCDHENKFRTQQSLLLHLQEQCPNTFKICKVCDIKVKRIDFNSHGCNVLKVQQKIRKLEEINRHEIGKLSQIIMQDKGLVKTENKIQTQEQINKESFNICIQYGNQKFFIVRPSTTIRQIIKQAQNIWPQVCGLAPGRAGKSKFLYQPDCTMQQAQVHANQLFMGVKEAKLGQYLSHQDLVNYRV